MSPRNEWELPTLREVHKLPGLKADLYSIKFYPYTEPGVDPIFAVVGCRHISIWRLPTLGSENTESEVIQTVLDDTPNEEFVACAWTKDLQTGTPLLCVAGDNAKILITLSGHGGEIDDLAVSPINPSIIASGSKDNSVRIWSLDPAHSKHPCAAILEGDGHRADVLSVAFHSNGRYLLSGGVDCIINLWTLPEFPDQNTGTSKPTRIYYPHFSTCEVNLGPVDCVQFYNDLILSRAADQNNIVLWSINGFSSLSPPPPPSTAPTIHDISNATRSAFTTDTTTTASGTPTTSYYTRLAQFKTPNGEIMFTRFSLFEGTAGGQHAVLAYCNSASQILFWDLERLVQFHDWDAAQNPQGSKTLGEENQESANSTTTSSSKEAIAKPPFLNPIMTRNRGGGVLSAKARTAAQRIARENSNEGSASSLQTPSEGLGGGEGEKVKWKETWKRWRDRYDTGDPFGELEAHGVVGVKTYDFTGRQVAWSADGQWCVVCGSGGVLAVMQRWGN